VDVLQFIAALLDSLAWPSAVIVLAFLFRGSIGKLLPALSKLKWKDLELEFKKELAGLSAAAQQAQLPPAEPIAPLPQAEAPAQLPPPPRTLESEIEAVAEVSPRAAIPLAWAAVETELLNAVMRLAVSPDYPPSNSAIQNIRHLQHAGAVDKETVTVLEQMRRLRNRTVHGDLEQASLSREDAVQYSRLAQQLIAKLRDLRR
jgi:hypothetical protein